jgi:putative transposase
MRYSATEKYEIIQLVQHSDLSVRQTLVRLAIHKSTFYNWLKRYEDWGFEGLSDKKPLPQVVWNRIAETHCEAIINMALDQPEFSPRELAVTYNPCNLVIDLDGDGIEMVQSTAFNQFAMTP